MSAATAAATGHPHAEAPSVLFRRQRLGVLLLILADVAFTLSLVFTYLYLRGLNTEDGWIPADGGTTAGIGAGWVIAAVMVVSLVAYMWGERGVANGHPSRLMVGSLLALALVLVDLALQVYQLATLPMHSFQGAYQGSYQSAFVALAGYHVVHLLLTLFIGLALWNRARVGLYSGDNHFQVRLVGYWWRWVTVAALITALTLSFTTAP
jgi:heme/copper-type cytochrome/quinol oxidase subunit 3